MKTEKQVEKMLDAVDEKTVDILNRIRKEYTKMYNESEYKFAYANRLLALMDIVDALGYDWKDEIADSIKLWNLKPLE